MLTGEFDLLRCPACRGRLSAEGDVLVCVCGLGYPIVDGIPLMLKDEAFAALSSRGSEQRNGPGPVRLEEP